MFGDIREKLTSNRWAISALVLIFILFAISCGYAPLAGHTSDPAISCNDALVFTNINRALMKGVMAILGFAMLLLAVASSLLRGDKISNPAVKSTPSRIVSFQKIYDPVLLAIRKGILHSQIYNSSLIKG